MKTSTLIFSLVAPVALASPLQSRSTVSTCNVKGFELSLPFDTIKGTTTDSCGTLCFNRNECNSFSYVSGTCSLYKSLLSSSSFIKFPLFGLLFSDKACVKVSTPSVPSAPSPTTAPPTATTPPTATGSPAATSTPETPVCVAAAVVNPLSTGSCGKKTGGTRASEKSSGKTSSVADCAMNCARGNCKSFGYFEGLCTLYGQSVADLNVDENTGIYTFYDSSCYIANSCN